MDESRTPAEAAPNQPLEELHYQGESAPFVGRWNRLVSTTNWEKGRIICEWREDLQSAEAPAAEYSDEAWSRRVGGVTGQHAGRLRRVYQRFGQVYQQFAGLYWSHFQAALEWNDAEMWLEGAVQNGWSVSQMRRQRWDVLGADEQLKPRDEDILVGELDEDFEPALTKAPDAPIEAEDFEQFVTRETAEEEASEADVEVEVEAPVAHRLEEQEAEDVVRPFEDLAELPADVAEAFEAFKLAILRHKTDGWKQISCRDLLSALDSLKELAQAPA
ncbi:MAG: hypothetical protein J5I93_16840 [Pirellulaceae bacterium]|nr:hypothetical protein [Pirellulaceae bacterium]